MYITYEEALRKPKKDIILENIDIKKYPYPILNMAMSFESLNLILHEELNELEYINFWNDVKIKEIN